MSDPAQANLTARMIARLEEANTRSYGKLKQANEISSEEDVEHRPPNLLKQANESSYEQDMEDGPSGQQPAQKRRLPRASLWFFAPVGLVLIVSMYVRPYIWEPSEKAVNISVPPQPMGQNDATREPIMPPEVEQRLQRMADELADVQRRIDQLKAGQDEINRNSAALAEQSGVGQEEMVRDNAPAKSARKPSRRTRLHRNAQGPARWPGPEWQGTSFR